MNGSLLFSRFFRHLNFASVIDFIKMQIKKVAEVDVFGFVWLIKPGIAKPRNPDACGGAENSSE